MLSVDWPVLTPVTPLVSGGVTTAVEVAAATGAAWAARAVARVGRLVWGW